MYVVHVDHVFDNNEVYNHIFQV